MAVIFDTPTPERIQGARVYFARLMSTETGKAGTAELCAFAEQLGLRREWLRKPGSTDEHFALFGHKIDAARCAGASETNARQLDAILRSKQHG